MQQQTILVTGGTGYIGSHTVVELLTAGYHVVIVDNLSNSNIKVLERIKQICAKAPDFYHCDILDKVNLEQVFAQHKFDAVIHFAALKAVAESAAQPYRYYHNNVVGSLTLFAVMAKYGVKSIVFSSSATVYGDPHSVPISEDFPVKPTNPYGRTKLMIEQILQDIYAADKDWSFAILRYFNPVGAHASGLIGEDPDGIPNNLMPYMAQVAIGKLNELNIFGNDYPTTDGTGVRDYIHVVDLAVGHLRALEYLCKNGGELLVNLGTGIGYSVFEVVKAFELASGKVIKYTIKPRRSGDVGECFANPEKASRLLKWQAKYDLLQMCRDMWNWQQKNPHGYL